ncbi:general substrate transporter [Boletus edulis BED1]|uniref:General substrate transporter n=1 Tax=Boletus edulis BED1 TaxID=1328754 RepID=A0AAD4BPQ9_BOLED|nr:general substrate transporter [Boletus edulis BED1]
MERPRQSLAEAARTRGTSWKSKRTVSDMGASPHKEMSPSPSLTRYGAFVVVWVLVLSFQYGYHISALNQLQSVLTCHNVVPDSLYYGLPTCMPMTDATFSLVTSMFTFGGLFGCLSANLIMDRYGRNSATRFSALFNTAGAAISGLAPSVAPMALGRFLVGVAAGIGICVGPIYLSEIAPPQIKGSLGVLTQLAIVVGILVTQGIGFGLATPTQWRLVLLISAALSAVQYLLAPAIVESPAYLIRNGLTAERKAALRSLWGLDAPQDPEDLDEEPLLTSSNEADGVPRTEQAAAVTIPELLASPELRSPLLTVVFAMASQQLSGINAVLYYSNNILSKSLPELAAYVSLGISVVNVLMTFPPIFLIERVGRKQLFHWSVGGALLSHLAVGYGLNSGWVAVTSVAITTFVMSFAIGLGPVPFVIIPEVAPLHAVSAISSVGLSMSWIINFFVGLVFLQVRNLLAHGDPMKEGRVFYVFAAVLFCSAWSFSRLYRG